MKFSTRMSLVCIAVATFSQLARSEEVQTKISEVTLYPDSAKVERALEYDLPAGSTTLLINYLPVSLDPGRVSANVEGSDVVVSEIVLGENNEPESTYAPLLALKAEVEKIGDALAAKRSELQLLKDKIKFADSYKNALTKGVAEGEDRPTMDELFEAWEFYASTVKEVELAIIPLQVQEKELEEQLDAKTKVYEELHEQVQKLQSKVALKLYSPRSEKIELKLHYYVHGCSWNRVYDIKAFPKDASVSIDYKASIIQNTGENWEDVAVTLSTSSANRYVGIPELYPIKLNKIEPRPVPAPSASRNMQKQQQEYVLSPFSVGREGDEEIYAGSTLAGTRAPVFSASFSSYSVALPAKTSIPSGREVAKRTIATKEVEAAFWTQIAPRESSDAVLMAECENPFEMPILPGRAHLFVDQQAVGNTRVDEIAPGAKTSFSLGVNENIFAEWRDGTDNEKNRGIFGKTRKLTRQYFTKVRNDASMNQKIKLFAQIPVSENEKIKIEQQAPDATAVTFDAEKPGVFFWEFTLAAGKERQFENTFEVSFPESWEIPTHF